MKVPENLVSGTVLLPDSEAALHLTFYGRGRRAISWIRALKAMIAFIRMLPLNSVIP